MNLRCSCKCGSIQFKHQDESIVCGKCGRAIEQQEKIGFFDPSDSKVKAFITKLGIDIGVEAATIGAGVLIGVVAPWTLPFTLTALGVIIKNGGDALSDNIIENYFDKDSYGKKLADIFEEELKNVLKKGKKSDTKYNSFYNYHNYCSLHYSQVLSLLIDQNINTDIYSDEAVKAIISDELGYPGCKEPEVLTNVLAVARELRNNFEKKIIDDKNIGLYWLVEKANSEQNNKISKIINLLESKYTDTIDDAIYEYIKNYARPLFLETDSDITLGKMYLEPTVKGTEQTAIDAIGNWYDDDKKQIIIVYGAAGIGKTSLVTKLISDVYEISGEKNILELDKDEIHSVVLRDNINIIREITKTESYSALKIIRSILNMPDSNLDGHLIILDGYDELCVLADSFDGKLFIQKLQKDLKSTNIKVMITSRPMEELSDSFISETSQIEIAWTEEQISKWCDRFSQFTNSENEEKWCNEFKDKYTTILRSSSRDNRLEMFSVPIILYLACKSNILVSENDTIGKFYDRVFRSIAERNHSENQISSGIYEGVPQERLLRLINWQFTKELAYQMFLNDTLTLTQCDKYGTDRIQYAKDRTIAVLHERGENITDDKKIDTALYLAVSHFSSENAKGIEFAHKTVYEYFTAVKLYEDYFAKFNREYFESTNPDIAVEEVWNNIIEAFRYARIPEEIFNYLNKMSLSAYNDDEQKIGGFDYENFEKCYVNGMKRHILSDIAVSKPQIEYKVNSAYVNTQLCLSFRNLSWFLSGHGFCNNDNIEECKNIEEMIRSDSSDVCFHKWKLDNVSLINCNLSSADLREVDFSRSDLTSALLLNSNLVRANLSNAKLNNVNLAKSNLRGANFTKSDLSGTNLSHANLRGVDLNELNLSGTNLSHANLRGADLNESDLSGTNLSYANLRGANLNKANLKNANLEGATLSYADFRDADLTDTNFRNALYCLDTGYKTKFSEDFDPVAHQMIEVDINGDPIGDKSDST